MKTTLKRSVVIYALTLLFCIGLFVLLARFVTKGDEWALSQSNKLVYSEKGMVNTGTVVDKNDKVLAYSKNGKRIYSDNLTTRMSMLHTIGDTELFIANSIQTQYKSELLGYNMLTGIDKDQQGGAVIKLTLDSTVCNAALKALNGRKGAVAVYNYKTGELICMVSSPTYDPQNKPAIDADSEKYNGVYVNRVISGLYPPGSTFKTVTAAAAIDTLPDALTKTWTCTGSYKTKDGVVTCRAKHGTQTLAKALSNSCNAVFAQVADEVGADAMTRTSNALRFNSALSLDKLSVKTNQFNVSDASHADLGWAGIGQYTTLVTPFQMMVTMGSIANDGIAVEPFVVENIKTPLGLSIHNGHGSNSPQMLSQATAKELQKLLRNNVKNDYGDSRFPGLTVCAKTGTAEPGGNVRPHSWFAGYLQNEDLPLAFAAVVENGGFGLESAGPVINSVLQIAKEQLKKSTKQ